ncbi:MAG TPA: alpha/beta hydrolase [Gemmatimonadales bacterium]
MSHVACMRDVALHYTLLGSGEPLVLVHGGGTDLTYWEPHLDAFADRYRVVAYSRRYAEPNRNAPIAPGYNPRTDADDLADLIAALELGSAHVVTHSIGGVAALFCAVAHPELFRTLTLAEPPLLPWAREHPDGKAGWDRFLHAMWLPAGEAFERGDPQDAMRHVTDYFVGDGTFARLPPRVRDRLMRNARDWEAFTTSDAPWPWLDPADVAALPMPVLMLSAGRSVPLHHFVDDLLAETIPGVERVRIPGATHDMWADEPDACRAATLDFLARRA